MASDSEVTQAPTSGSSKKRKWFNNSVRHGSRKHGDKRNKGRDLGGKAKNQQDVDQPEQNETERNKRRKLNVPDVKESTLPKPFSEEEIAAEERRPKHKVAVMIGYAGSGYKGMQINWSEKTIEGDIFHAFVKAGAISKANANDPKKSSLVRCARTDKGVHAAGNVISLKLIIEDPEVVEKINTHLPAQIRVWGIERTIGSFSCYQACDSRWYEYLIPTHCLLPPHPTSFLAKQLEKTADETDDRKGYEERQADVAGFWQSIEETDIRPLFDSMDEETRSQVIEALYKSEEDFMADRDGEDRKEDADSTHLEASNNAEEAEQSAGDDAPASGHGEQDEGVPDQMIDSAIAEMSQSDSKTSGAILTAEPIEEIKAKPQPLGSTKAPLDPNLIAATKRLRTAYLTAKRRYRVPASRIARFQTALSAYEGTHNFYNYTIQKTGRDASARRHIKSFKVNPQPILKRISGNDATKGNQEGKENVDDEAEETEWLSLKVHGQSFMMHQIRKMVCMAALAVRCGADPVPLIQQSYDPTTKFSIPKAPGLGLLLERPVFESYNKKVDEQFKDRAPVGFEKYEQEMEEFKEREIYARVFGEEQRDGVFHGFFGHVDNYREPYFLFVTSKGWEATKGAKYRSLEKGGDRKMAGVVESEDDEEKEGAEGEGREG